MHEIFSTSYIEQKRDSGRRRNANLYVCINVTCHKIIISGTNFYYIPNVFITDGTILICASLQQKCYKFQLTACSLGAKITQKANEKCNMCACFDSFIIPKNKNDV